LTERGWTIVTGPRSGPASGRGRRPADDHWAYRLRRATTSLSRALAPTEPVDEGAGDATGSAGDAVAGRRGPIVALVAPPAGETPQADAAHPQTTGC
jgi:hypothetical protein